MMKGLDAGLLFGYSLIYFSNYNSYRRELWHLHHFVSTFVLVFTLYLKPLSYPPTSLVATGHHSLRCWILSPMQIVCLGYYDRNIPCTVFFNKCMYPVHTTIRPTKQSSVRCRLHAYLEQSSIISSHPSTAIKYDHGPAFIFQCPFILDCIRIHYNKLL